jgi:hypothetical protein
MSLPPDSGQLSPIQQRLAIRGLSRKATNWWVLVLYYSLIHTWYLRTPTVYGSYRPTNHWSSGPRILVICRTTARIESTTVTIETVIDANMWGILISQLWIHNIQISCVTSHTCSYMSYCLVYNMETIAVKYYSHNDCKSAPIAH